MLEGALVGGLYQVMPFLEPLQEQSENCQNMLEK